VAVSNVSFSLHHRSFGVDGEVPEHSRLARELAKRIIESNFNVHTTKEALDFINSVSLHPFECSGAHLLALRSHPLVAAKSVPPPYGLKGGAAREALIETLNLRPPEKPRDLDLIRRGNHLTERDEDVAREFMPSDYPHGARIELVTDLSRYFSSRDLTINEIAVLDGSLHTSILAVLDTIAQLVRPSRYRGGSLHRSPSISGRTLLKMIRLKAESTVRGELWGIVGIPLETTYSEMDLAIHLNKAYQRGKPVAETFASHCATLGLIHPDQDALKYLLSELEHFSHGEHCILRDVPREDFSGPP
jgi:hypothetical protein